MNYILIKGARNAGKSKTINEVCRRLKPEKVQKIIFISPEECFLEQISRNSELVTGNYIITVRNKNVLIVASSPTGQRKKITAIIEPILRLDIKLHFAIIAVRGLEKLGNFATARELTEFGKCIFETKIRRIPAHAFEQTEEWNKRAAYIVAITKHNI